MNFRKYFIITTTLASLGIALLSLLTPNFLLSFIILGPIMIMGYADIFQDKHTIKKNFPVIGRLRYLLESVRPEIMQYFVETDIEGRPINRMFRSIVYQRSKKVTDTTPFGTQSDVYKVGYEWMNHSLYPKQRSKRDSHPRVLIGGPDCKIPYSASLLNISAMSYGALSKNAILALNKGAKADYFAHNTGEGGISPYHEEHGGDLIWQIGTGYFGCRTKEGNFSETQFSAKAVSNQIKMIEIKISQGAKPGHGGILPASKNTPEIAAIRGVKAHLDIHSPPMHSAFRDAEGLMKFIQSLRDLSGGKPVGFKLCVGKKSDFTDICKAMVSTGIKPDFITIDGGEGGTGAAPLEFSNSLGMPLRDGLSFAYDTLVGCDLKTDIKLIASGKILTGFHIVRALALGADLCYSARGMMLAVGCIQALQCNTNNCPTGVATQNPGLMKGLHIANKADRVANFHHETLHSFSELIAASGIENPDEITRSHVNRRVSATTVMSYEELYPYTTPASLLPIGTQS